MTTVGVLVYDGDCGFCERSVARIARATGSRARRVPWQDADLGRLGLAEEECRTAVQWVEAGRRSSGARALRDFAAASGRWAPRTAARALVNPVTLPLADSIYRLVARNRHRLGSASCAVPPATAHARVPEETTPIA